jgi:hypothetical protein
VLLFFGRVDGGEAEVPPPREEPDVTVTAHPNPFNPVTRIGYAMPRAGRLTLRIYNLRGGLVRALLDGEVGAGRGSVDWRGDDDAGRAVAAGVYFCEARARGRMLVKKLVSVK